MIDFFKNFYKNSSAKLLLSLFFFVMALFIFAVITDEVLLEKEEKVDFLIFDLVRNHLINPGATWYMSAFTDLSSMSLMKIAYPALIIILVLFKNYRRAFFSFVVGSGGLLIIYLMKIFFARPRPPYPLLNPEEGFSFPSGHSTFSFIFYGTLAYFVWLTDLPKIWRYLMMSFLVLLSLMIAFSRIYLRVHYPSDVLGGIWLGYSWLFLMIYAFRKWFPIY